MQKILFTFILAVEIFALANRGGGPLLSHLFLTGITFLALMVLFVSMAHANRKAQPMSGFKLGPPQLFYALFLLCFVISLFFSLIPGFGLAELLLFANAGILLIVFNSAELRENDLRFFAALLVGLAVADTLIGYFIYTHNAFPRFAGTFLDIGETYTSFGNDYANFLLLIIPIAALPFLQKHKRVTTTILSGLALAILFSGFLLSFSRGALLSLIAVAIITCVWRWFYRKRAQAERSAYEEGGVHQTLGIKQKALRLGAVLLLTILLINGLQLTRSQRYQTTSFFKKAAFDADEGAASFTERIDFWKGAAHIIKDRPLFGGGVLSFKFLYPKYQPHFGTDWDHPHNILLKIGVENGIFAMAFFTIFLGSAAFFLRRFFAFNQSHTAFPFVLGALGSLGHNFIDFNYIVGNFVLFIIFIACALSCAEKQKISTPDAPKAPHRHTPFVVAIILLLFSASLLALGAHEGYYNIDFKKGREALAQGRLNEAALRLENARRYLFFRRDVAHYLAAAYEQQFKKTKNELWTALEEDLISKELMRTSSEFLPTHGVDADLIAAHGELFMRRKLYGRAEMNFEQAIALDPSNKLRYYFDLLNALRAQRKKIAPQLRQKILALLEEYAPVLRYNRHMTAITDNPQYAIALYGFFKMPKEAELLRQIWFEEYVKFTVKYGPVQKVI